READAMRIRIEAIEALQAVAHPKVCSEKHATLRQRQEIGRAGRLRPGVEARGIEYARRRVGRRTREQGEEGELAEAFGCCRKCETTFKHAGSPHRSCRGYLVRSKCGCKPGIDRL